MIELLIHTSNIKVNVLKPTPPYPGATPAIYLSRNCIVPMFGQYVYLFDEEVLKSHFHMASITGSGPGCYARGRDGTEYRYRSLEQLEREYLIYEEISVSQYALGVVTLFDVMKGEMEEAFNNEVIKREIIRLQKR